MSSKLKKVVLCQWNFTLEHNLPYIQYWTCLNLERRFFDKHASPSSKRIILNLKCILRILVPIQSHDIWDLSSFILFNSHPRICLLIWDGEERGRDRETSMRENIDWLSSIQALTRDRTHNFSVYGTMRQSTQKLSHTSQGNTLVLYVVFENSNNDFFHLKGRSELKTGIRWIFSSMLFWTD